MHNDSECPLDAHYVSLLPESYFMIKSQSLAIRNMEDLHVDFGGHMHLPENLLLRTSISDTSPNNRAAAYYSSSACRMSYKIVNFIVESLL